MTISIPKLLLKGFPTALICVLSAKYFKLKIEYKERMKANEEIKDLLRLSNIYLESVCEVYEEIEDGEYFGWDEDTINKVLEERVAFKQIIHYNY